MKKRALKNSVKPSANSADKISVLFEYAGIRGWIIVGLGSVIVSLFFFFYHLKDWYGAKPLCFYDGKPVMATFDAYYFMRLTEEHLTGGYDNHDYFRNAPRPRPVPLLVRIAGLMRSITGAPVEYIAWLLPPILASFTVIMYGCWARFFSNPFLFVIASTIGSTAYVWFWRTSLGRFDTDSLNILFPAIISGWIYLEVVNDKITRKLLSFIIIAFAIFIWHLWWPQGRNIGLLATLGTYGVSLFFIRSRKWENILRGIVLFGGVLGVVATVLHVLTESFPLPKILHPLMGYASLIFKSSNPVNPSVGESITELKSVNLLQGANQIFGHWILGFPALIGVILTVSKKPFFLVLWIPFLILGMIGFISNRFLIFLVPPLAFGLAFFSTVWLINARRISAILKKWRYLAALAVSIAFVLPNIILNLKTVRIPNVAPHLVKLAKVLEPGESKGETVWAWWDYGYLLQYYARKKTFIDGGTQEFPRIAISAYAFSTEDIAVAKNWINSFSVNDLSPLIHAQQKLGDRTKAFQFLREAFEGEETLKEVLRKYGQESNEKLWYEMLYPKARNFLFIPVDFFKKSYWWYYYGSWDYETGKGKHPFVVHFPRWFVNISPEKGYLTTLDGKKIFFDRYVFIRKDQFPGELTIQSNSSATLFVTIPGIALMLGKDVSESTALKLYRHPNDFGHAFELIYYHPFYGGVWRTVYRKDQN